MALSASLGHGPLKDLIVVDLTRFLSGPYCSLLLSDLGARVIKIESPGKGDESRTVPPILGKDSPYFMSINRGKESIALDLKNDDDRAVLATMLEQADILIENFRPGIMDKLGYSAQMLAERYPRLVYASISGFGQTGPWRNLPAYDLVVQALSGMMSINGQADGPPTRVGTSIGDLGAGVYAALSVVSAINERHRTGLGGRVDMSMLDCQVALLESHFMRYSVTGEVPGRVGSRHPLIVPFDAYACADSYMVVCTVGDGLYRQLVEALGRPDLIDDERFCTPAKRLENEVAMKNEFETLFRTQPRSHWLKVIGDAGVPCGPINTIADIATSPQLEARGLFVDVTSDSGYSFKAVRTPVRQLAKEEAAQSQRAPSVDEHGPAIRAELLAETH
ncbi:CoA transferase [Pseudomonas agarici]|uniref:CaiB/BaiF CoA transferase family protein n=1 Tax=Pseudomonas agarici TaxID=46677 RepID=UPI0002ECD2DE|nr:CaiB/BaiF CoA-transferase family protein [Pseudomonas agarici]NWC07679.1 CoA transferase [Pseudomonas agarici]SEL76492.1 CoA:oxalate CoA-transferase [Pseudomonas agarici]